MKMIPKIIHYCWFGGKELPDESKKYIDTWKKWCPDYVIKEWNETNIDINICEYVKEAYDAKKWAFVSDYVRLYVLVNEGGIYMDTDVELLAPLDNYLKHKAFSGFEDETSIPTGIMGAEKEYKLFEKLLSDYEDRHFINSDGTMNLSTNVVAITETCKKHGFIPNNSYQEIEGFALYPKDYFCPKSYVTGEINLSPNTVAIHHFNSSWQSRSMRISRHINGWFIAKNMPLMGRVIAFPWTIVARIQLMGIKKTIVYFGNKVFKREQE